MKLSYNRKGLKNWHFLYIMPGDEMGGYLIVDTRIFRNEQSQIVHLHIGKVLQSRPSTQTNRRWAIFKFNRTTGHEGVLHFSNKAQISQWFKENHDIPALASLE
tara:strand:- start:2915 stop:3226 length:312 start_codon:yes stop_codon:yes gene_type:complete